MQEASDRFRVQFNAVFRQSLPQFPYRPVRALGNQPMNQRAMRFKAVALVASVLARSRRSSLPLTLSPTDNRRNRKTEPGGHHTTTAASLKRRHNPFAKIKRIRSNHHILASIPSQYVESEPD